MVMMTRQVRAQQAMSLVAAQQLWFPATSIDRAPPGVTRWVVYKGGPRGLLMTKGAWLPTTSVNVRVHATRRGGPTGLQVRVSRVLTADVGGIAVGAPAGVLTAMDKHFIDTRTPVLAALFKQGLDDSVSPLSHDDKSLLAAMTASALTGPGQKNKPARWAAARDRALAILG